MRPSIREFQNFILHLNVVILSCLFPKPSLNYTYVLGIVNVDFGGIS